MNCLPEAIKVFLIEPNDKAKKEFTGLLKECNLNTYLTYLKEISINILPGRDESQTPHLIFLSVTNSEKVYSYISDIKSCFPHTPIILLTKEHNPAPLPEGVTDIICKSDLNAFVLKKIIEYNCMLQRESNQHRKLVERLELLSRATNDIVWDWQLQKKCAIWFGNGLKRSLGYNQSTLKVDTTFWERGLHPDDKDRVISRLKSYFIDNQLNEWEEKYRFKTVNGEYRYFHDRGYIIYENGIAVRLVGIMEDISSRVQLEEKLNEEQLLKQKEIAEAVVNAQEKERSEIGKELHDNVNQ